MKGAESSILRFLRRVHLSFFAAKFFSLHFANFSELVFFVLANRQEGLAYGILPFVNTRLKPAIF